jgi:hypothetical protein
VTAEETFRRLKDTPSTKFLVEATRIDFSEKVKELANHTN